HPRLAGLVKASEAATDTGTLHAPSSAGPNGAVLMAATDTATAGGTGAGKFRQDPKQSASEVDASAPLQAGGGASLGKAADTSQPGQPSEPVPPPKTDDQEQIDNALQHPGPISLFVSRRLGKLFVRKGFAPVFDPPITIAHPELPLGTHI